MKSDLKVLFGSYHAGVNGGLLDVASDARDKRIPVLEVGVEVRLRRDRQRPSQRNRHRPRQRDTAAERVRERERGERF